MKNERDAHASENDELRRKREQRLKDCLRSALEHPDPMQALVRAASGDLAETAGQLKDAIDQALQDEPDLRSVFAEIAPLLEMFLKFHRQFDRFVQLDHRLTTPSTSLPAAHTQASLAAPQSAAPPSAPASAHSLAPEENQANEESQM